MEDSRIALEIPVQPLTHDPITTEICQNLELWVSGMVSGSKSQLEDRKSEEEGPRLKGQPKKSMP